MLLTKSQIGQFESTIGQCLSKGQDFALSNGQF